MKTFVIIGIGVLLITASFLKGKSRALTRLIYVYMFIVYTFCNGGTLDLETYKWTYAEQINVSFKGFDTLMNVFSSLGVPFVVFKGFCGVFVLTFLSKAIKLFFEEENVVLALCLIFPFFSGISQIKNGMAAALVLYAALKYVKDPKHRIFPFIIMILFASLIHATALIYLIFVLAKKNFKEMKKTTIIIAVLLVVMVELILTQNLAYNIARVFIRNEYYLRWFDYEAAFAGRTDETLNFTGQIIPVIGQIMGFVLFKYLERKGEMLSEGQGEKCPSKSGNYLSREQVSMIGNMYLLLMFMIPFYQLSPTYFRIYKNVVPMMYIMASQFIGRSRHINLKISRPVLITIGLALIAMMMTGRYQGSSTEMFESFSLW